MLYTTTLNQAIESDNGKHYLFVYCLKCTYGNQGKHNPLSVDTSKTVCLHFCKYLEMIRHIVLRYYMMNVTCGSLYCNQSSIVSVTQSLIVCDNITTTTRNRAQSNLYHQEILWCQVCFLGYETLLIIWEIRFHFF